MADPSQRLPPNQLQALFTAIHSIDQRLNRIEAALQINSYSNNNNAHRHIPTNAAQVQQVQVTPIPPPPIPNNAQHQQHAQQLQQQQHAQHPQQQRQAGVQAQLGNPAVANNGPALGMGGSVPMSAPVPVPVPVPVPAMNFRPLEAPPQGYSISSRAMMQEELDQWTIPRGYSMRIAGAKVTGKRKVRWVCFRGGEARHHRAPVDDSVILQARAEGRRKPTTDRASKKCGCRFKFELIETSKGSDTWMLHYPNEEHKVHNHGPSDQTSDPRARKLPPYVSDEVDQWLRNGWLVSKIQEELKARGFTNVLNTDLYNRKRLLKKEHGQLM